MGWIKGEPVVVFRHQQLAKLSDKAVDVRRHNAAAVAVTVSGEGTSATVSVEGSSEEGGNYSPVVDPNGSQSAVTSGKLFYVITGMSWIKIRLADLAGTFQGNQGYTVEVTPFVSPGPGTITATVT